ERVAAYKSRWERAGKKVGEFEEYLRGGEQPSVEGVMNETPVAMVNGLGGGKDLNGMVAGMGNLKVGE
ncbi:Phosphatidylinositol transfer protein (PITP), partial [Cryomyces antarcticus]